MATVLLAEDELLGRQVALKRMSTEDMRGLSRQVTSRSATGESTRVTASVFTTHSA